MILGKRTRPPIKRTTSMTEVTVDLNRTAVAATGGGGGGGRGSTESPYDPFNMNPSSDVNNNNNSSSSSNNNNNSFDHRWLTTPNTTTPRNHRRNSADHMESARSFLAVCHLCSRRLITGRDIFMYRGDSAFCSSECRQEQMNHDEKKDKQPLVPKKPAAILSESSSEVSNKTG